jgi:hypothetical protein
LQSLPPALECALVPPGGNGANGTEDMSHVPGFSLSDTRTPQPTAGAERLRVPERTARVPAEHLLIESLGSVVGAFLGPGASDAERADLLGEVFVAVRLHDDLGRGVYPRRGTVTARSRGMADLEVVLAAAVRRYRASATEAVSPTAWPAGLEVPGGLVESGFQPGALSASDEVTLREAAALLGLRSSEWPRQLIQSGELDGWQEAAGHREWHVTRASVIAYRQRRDGSDGPGGDEGQRVA